MLRFPRSAWRVGTRISIFSRAGDRPIEGSSMHFNPKLAAAAVSLVLAAHAIDAGAVSLTYDIFAQSSGTGGTTDCSAIPTTSPCFAREIGTATLTAGDFSKSVSATSTASNPALGISTSGAASASFTALPDGPDAGKLLKFDLHSTGNTTVAKPPFGQVSTQSGARFNTLAIGDLLTFDVASSLRGQDVFVDIVIPFDGLFSTRTNALLTLTTGFGGISSTFDSYALPNTGGATMSVHDQLSFTYQLSKASSFLDHLEASWFFSVVAGCSAGSPSCSSGPFDIDFGHTVGLQIFIPDGVTMSTASGILERFVNPDTTTPVDEPTTFVLFAMGLATLWTTARHRRGLRR